MARVAAASSHRTVLICGRRRGFHTAVRIDEVSMYRLLRNTHLFLGLAAFLFVLMYGLSGVQMAHDTWFSMKPVVTEMRVSLAANTSDNPRAIARQLRDVGVRGEMGDVAQIATGYKFAVSRPGTNYQVECTRATREAKIKVSTAGFMGMLN